MRRNTKGAVGKPVVVDAEGRQVGRSAGRQVGRSADRQVKERFSRRTYSQKGFLQKANATQKTCSSSSNSALVLERKKVARLISEVSVLRKSKNESDKQCSFLKRRTKYFEKLAGSKEGKIKELTNLWDAEKKAHAATKNKWEDSEVAHGVELKAAEADNAKLQEEVRRLMAELDRLNGSLQAGVARQVKEGLEAEIKGLSATVETLEKSQGETLSQLAASQEASKKLREENDQLKKQHDGLVQKINTLNGKLKKNNTCLAEAKVEVGRLGGKNYKLEEERQLLLNEVETLKVKNKEINKELKSERSKAHQKKDEIGVLNERLKKEMAPGFANSQELAGLKSKIKKLEKKVSQKEEEISGINAELKRSKDFIQANYESVSKERGELFDETKNLKKINASLESEVLSLKVALEKSKQAHTLYLVTRGSQVAELEQEVAELEKEVAELKQKLEKKEAEVKRIVPVSTDDIDKMRRDHIEIVQLLEAKIAMLTFKLEEKFEKSPRGNTSSFF